MTVLVGIAAGGVGATASPRSEVSFTDSSAQPPSVFVAVSPLRVLDTRPAPNGPIGVPTSAPVGGGQQLALRIAGDAAAIPAEASAALINVTIDSDASLPSFMTIWPTGEPRPQTSANNALPGSVAANSTLAKIGTGGSINIFNQAGAVNVVIDVVGYTLPLTDVDLPGNNLLSGAGAPTTAVGEPGDFYLDTTGKVLFGPRTAATWPAPGISLSSGEAGPAGPAGPTGAVGPAGPAGSRILTGTADPTTQGLIGDVYVNTNTGVIWTKSADGWTASSGSIKGPTGEAGAVGADGLDGEDGSRISTGTTIPDPNTGANGDLYVDTTTGTLYTKTANVWTANPLSLKGAAGPEGARGPAGAAGSQILSGTVDPTTQGDAGDVYVNTATGVIWTKSTSGWVAGAGSIKGADGATGPVGVAGPTGPAGTDGANGTKVTAGTADPVAGSGVDGDIHVNTTTGVVWTKSNGPWTPGTGSVKGIPGAASKYNSPGTSVSLSVGGSSSSFVAFANDGPEFGSVSTPASPSTSFLASTPGVYEVTYQLGIGVGVLGSATAEVVVNGVVQGQAASFTQVLSAATQVSGTVLVRTTTANADIRLRLTNSALIGLGVSLGESSFMTVKQLSVG